NGIIKAQGSFINEMMEGEWKFYYQEGVLWQTANFKENKKHGVWIRYDKNGLITYNQTFENGKQVK
ncbi:MAG: toxin-antitoxin system YwqK family antitoxin, partial [Christensenellales bacterium]